MTAVIPVMDLKGGVVVQAVRGERDSYRPITSVLASSPDPSVILRGFTNLFATKQIYVADIDSLQGNAMNRCALAELSRFDVEIIVDRGARHAVDLEEVFELGGTQAVVALETTASPADAADWLREYGADKLIAGIDLKHGQSLASSQQGWQKSPEQICQQFLEAGYRQFLVLDLAGVGASSGLSTLELCRTLKRLPEVRRVSTGGGIRSAADIQLAAQAGIDDVLVSTALHNGKLLPEDLH